MDASAIDLSVMGTMGGMDGQQDQMPGNASADEPNGQRGQPPGEMGGFPGQDDGQTSPRSADRAGQGSGPNQDLDPTENSAGWAGRLGAGRLSGRDALRTVAGGAVQAPRIKNARTDGSGRFE